MLLVCVKYYVLSASQIVSIDNLTHTRQGEDDFTCIDLNNSLRLLLSCFNGKMNSLPILLNKDSGF